MFEVQVPSNTLIIANNGIVKAEELITSKYPTKYFFNEDYTAIQSTIKGFYTTTLTSNVSYNHCKKEESVEDFVAPNMLCLNNKFSQEETILHEAHAYVMGAFCASGKYYEDSKKLISLHKRYKDIFDPRIRFLYPDLHFRNANLTHVSWTFTPDILYYRNVYGFDFTFLFPWRLIQNRFPPSIIKSFLRGYTFQEKRTRSENSIQHFYVNPYNHLQMDLLLDLVGIEYRKSYISIKKEPCYNYVFPLEHMDWLEEKTEIISKSKRKRIKSIEYNDVDIDVISIRTKEPLYLKTPKYDPIYKEFV